jgi:hypothetical protein
MDLPRKLGVGIVTLVPAFVLGGALWSLTNSWIAAWILEVLFAIGYGYWVWGKKNSARHS